MVYFRFGVLLPPCAVNDDCVKAISVQTATLRLGPSEGMIRLPLESEAVMRSRLVVAMVALLVGAPSAAAQPVIRGYERLTSDRPEAWAMYYLTGTSFMTAFGATPELAPGDYEVAIELGEIPRFDESQRQVGFHGFKNEDLNKSPVFGRLRAWIGLPRGFAVELAYTPPAEIGGAKPQDLFAAAIAARVLARENLVLSARLFGQHGAVTGDVTCPAELASVADPVRNPYGCEAPSDDRMEMNYYGLEATASWLLRRQWEWHASLGTVRAEPEVQVDALTNGFRDRSRLVTKGVLPYVALGVGRRWDQRWRIALEILHVPLDVRRQSGASRESDPLTSLRLQLSYGIE